MAINILRMLITLGSSTIAPEENCPPTPKLTLTQTLTLNSGQFSSGANVWLSPNPNTSPNLDSNPNPKRGAIHFGGQLSEYHIMRIIIKLKNFHTIQFNNNKYFDN